MDYRVNKRYFISACLNSHYFVPKFAALYLHCSGGELSCDPVRVSVMEIEMEICFEFPIYALGLILLSLYTYV